jgi:hypothetical protein
MVIMKCTKPNCDCAEKEMIKQGTELIKNYPCLCIEEDSEKIKEKVVDSKGLLQLLRDNGKVINVDENGFILDGEKKDFKLTMFHEIFGLNK